VLSAKAPEALPWLLALLLVLMLLSGVYVCIVRIVVVGVDSVCTYQMSVDWALKGWSPVEAWRVG